MALTELVRHPPASAPSIQAYGVQAERHGREHSELRNRRRDSDDAVNTTMPRSGASISGNGDNAPVQQVRRRVSRACDQCNQLRTKCDGKSPCAHCVEFALTCEYARARKKRGKASKKDLAAQQVAPAGVEDDRNGSANSHSSGDDCSPALPQGQQVLKRKMSKAGLEQDRRSRSISDFLPQADQHQALPNVGRISEHDLNHPAGGHTAGPPTPGTCHPPLPMSACASQDLCRGGMLRPIAQAGQCLPQHGEHPQVYSLMPQASPNCDYSEGPYSLPSPNSQKGLSRQAFDLGESPIATTLMEQSSHAGPSSWANVPCQNNFLDYSYLQPATFGPASSLRYPVLQPVVAYLQGIMPISLACDLLESYFATTSAIILHPRSPYILGFIFRKHSFLRQTSPRVCNPALLASMIWISAHESDAAFLQSPPRVRAKVCQKLYNLIISLLRPLIHESPDVSQNVNSVEGIGLEGFGIAFNGQSRELGGGSPSATVGVDDIATYVHIATVASASEYKAASMRWWNAAWSLAREMKLGHELRPHSAQSYQGSEFENDSGGTNRASYSEEEMEERRRLWWLLFGVDRHLALCYNRPLFLLDAECDQLLQPEDDLIWQAGEFYTGPSHENKGRYRSRGPTFECSGHSVFGYMLPIMTILGHIVDLNQQRNHPRFGAAFANSVDWHNQVASISDELEAYGRSLVAFKERNHAMAQAARNGTRTNGINDHRAGSMVAEPSYDTMLQTDIVVAYSTHIMHTMYILLNSKWDPISLLENNDSWISTESFVHASQHAVDAARAIDDILKYDSAIEQMPWFWGIYLLQASFLLLLIADKLQVNVRDDEVKACETIVRAHEACMVTLNTEYQKNFRNVMNSALAQVRRIKPPSVHEQSKRKELLALYRWTPDGTGLAL